MTESKRFNFAARLVVIALSSITMLWLHWRLPIPTSIASIMSLAFLLHCVHFARWVDLAAACRTKTSAPTRVLESFQALWQLSLRHATIFQPSLQTHQ
jgi:hypothetical protein